MKTCPSCQKENPFDSRFCAFCGASMEDGISPVPATYDTLTVEPDSGSSAEALEAVAAPSPAAAPVSAPKPAAMPPVMPAYPPVRPAVPPAYPPAGVYPPQPPFTPLYVVRKPHGGLAIAAFVLSLLAFFCSAMGLFNVFLYVGIALTIGAWATMKPEKGKGLAVAAIVLSALALVSSFIVTAAWFSEYEDNDSSYSNPYDDRYGDLYDDWLFDGNDRI